MLLVYPPTTELYPQVPLLTAISKSKFSLSIQTNLNYSLFASERVLPPDWLQFTHPEGKTYFYHPRYRIITEAWIYTPNILSKVVNYAFSFFRIIQQRNDVLPITSELCLELDPDNDPEPGCTYYLVDHASRTEFWAEEVTTDMLDMQPVTSQAHLSPSLFLSNVSIIS